MSSPPVDPRRLDKVVKYKAPQNAGQGVSGGDDFMPDYMNILGMIFSMCGLMMKLKWCGKFSIIFSHFHSIYCDNCLSPFQLGWLCTVPALASPIQGPVTMQNKYVYLL